MAAKLWKRWPLWSLLAVAAVAYVAAVYRSVVGGAREDELRAADAIVVFGAAEYDGRPSPVYRARLDHAAELYHRHLAPIIIATGGAGAHPRFSYGAVGHGYLKRLYMP